MSLRDIPKFEKMNNLSFNVYGLTDTNKVQILKISNNYKNEETHIDLLYFSVGKNSHYTNIKNFSRLTKSQIYKRKCKTYPCKRCLNSFHTKERLNQHSKYCSKSTAINLPKAGSNISFKDFNKSIKHLFVIYADFESILEKIDTVSPNPN